MKYCESENITATEKEKLIIELKAAMDIAFKMLEFEYAIELREKIKELSES